MAAEKWDPQRGAFSTYAITCIRREMIDELRRAIRRTRGERRIDAALDVPNREPAVEKRVVDAVYADWILSHLPRAWSDLLVGRVWLGLYEREQADGEGVTRQAISLRIGRAKQRVRERVRE